MRQRAALALTLSLALPGLATADGSWAMTSPRQQMPTATPAQEAVESHNEGISYRDKAAAYEKDAAAETDAKKKQKLEAKAKDRHEASIKKFLTATKKDPRVFQAWGSLGYAYRVTGNYTASLGAYAKALEIQPAYTPAIEYRAKAYLVLAAWTR